MVEILPRPFVIEIGSKLRQIYFIEYMHGFQFESSLQYGD